jgi:hypothetical protein
MHEHIECDHNLKYCSKCDVVYCTKCSKEWGGHKYYWYSQPYTIYTGVNTDGTVVSPNKDYIQMYGTHTCET